MRRLTACLLLVPVLGLAACGGDDEGEDDAAESAVSTTAAASPERSARCESATIDLTAPLGNGIEPADVRLTKVYLVQSSGHDGIYFVSAEIDGPGYENPGDVATWASKSRFGGDLIYAVDDLANTLSTLRDGRRVAGLSLDDDGVAESRACASS